MKNPRSGFALLFVAALPLHAQDGCLSSPENPTAVLALVGSAGAFCATIRTRIKARRRSSMRMLAIAAVVVLAIGLSVYLALSSNGAVTRPNSGYFNCDPANIATVPANP